MTWPQVALEIVRELNSPGMWVLIAGWIFMRNANRFP